MAEHFNIVNRLHEIGKGGGSDLPSGGEPFQQLVTGADGAAKWAERTHYTGQGTETIFNGTPVYLRSSYGMGLFQVGGEGDAAIRLSPEYTYTVIFDGAEYTGLSITEDNPQLEAFNYDTGEGCILMDTDDYLIMNAALTDTNEHTLVIIATGVVTVPLSEVYIPSSVPVIPAAEVGQTVVITAVDDNGKPIAWKATPQLQTLVFYFYEVGLYEKCNVSGEQAYKLIDNGVIPVGVYRWDNHWGIAYPNNGPGFSRGVENERSYYYFLYELEGLPYNVYVFEDGEINYR